MYTVHTCTSSFMVSMHCFEVMHYVTFILAIQAPSCMITHLPDMYIHVHLLQPSLSRGKLSSLATNSVRLKKKVVPTLISNRPRRPKLDRPDGSKLDRPDGSKLDRPDGSKPDRPDGSKPDRPDGSKSDRPDGSKPDRPDGSKPDRPAVELVAQGSTHVDHNDRSSAQNPPSSHTAVRPVAESNESQVSVSHPAAHYSHTLGRRNNVSLTCCKFTLNTKHICVVTYMYMYIYNLCFFLSLLLFVCD